MKKTIFCLTLAALAFSFSSSQAHDLWVNARLSPDATLEAEIGYGHDFPSVEAISQERIHIFEPLKLFGKDSVDTLIQDGENYRYVSSGVLKAGSYLIAANYKPTYWSRNKDGWKPENREQMKDADHCSLATMFGKNVLNVSGSKSMDFVTRPLGHKLEIVPLQNPADYQVNKPFHIKILFDGKPLKTAPVTATFAGFPAYQWAFYGHTDLNGEIDILPLRAGQWMVKVKHDMDYEDKSVCDQASYAATLSFVIDR